YGDAGCIITNNDELAVKCRMYARHGALKKHQHQIEGINSRMDGLQAAILSVKLPHILGWTEKRIKNAQLYSQLLKEIPEIIIPGIRPDSKHTFHLYVVRSNKRNKLQAFLKENEIETAIHYPTALPNMEAYKYLHHTSADYKTASQYQDQILSLPMYPELTSESIEYITEKIKEFISE